MAYIVNTTQTAGTTSGATYTVTLGAHATNDLLLCCLVNDQTSTNITAPAGWAMIGTQAASITKHAWAYKIAASGSETNPQFSGGSAAWFGVCLVVRDADASTPFGSLVSGTDYIRSDWTTGTTHASNEDATLTTAANGCLLLYSWGINGNLNYARCKSSDLVSASLQCNAACCQIVGYTQQEASGVAPAVTAYLNASDTGQGWVLAIRNKTNGAYQPVVSGTINDFAWYGSWTAHFPNPTWQAPDQFAASINGITCTSTAPTVSNNNSFTSTPWGLSTGLANAESTSGLWAGGTHTITSTDMSGKVFSVQYGVNGNSTFAGFGAEGILVGFSDGTNWVVYRVNWPAFGFTASTQYAAFIALGEATAYASSGSINWGAVTRVGYFYHRAGSTGASIAYYIKNAKLITNYSLSGGGSSRPSNLYDFYQGANSWGELNQSNLQGSAQILGKASLQIGDGTKTTYFDASASAYEYPVAWSQTTAAIWQMEHNASANSIDLSIKASANDTINYAAAVAVTDVQQNLTIDSSSDTGATYSFAGTSFVGWNPTWKTGVNVSSATFKECGEIDAKGSDWTDCTISKTTSTDAAIAFSEDGGSMTRCTIDVTGTSAAYHLELGTAVTAITLTDVTFTGTPTTDKVHVRKTTGTVTITTSGTTVLAAGDVTSEGATVSIVAPTLERGIAFSGLQTGTSIQVFTSGTQTKLYGDNSTAGSTFSFDDATAGSITVDYTIQKAGYLPQRVTGQVLTGAVGGQLEVTVTQIPDRAYVASSGLTYGTTAVVTVGTNPTTNPGTKTFQLTTASTGQNWYSFWIEQWIDKGNATGEDLANVAFPLQANGPNSFTLTNGWEFSDGATSIAFLSRDGLRYLNASSVRTAQWAAILTAGVPSGARVRYQQSDAGTTVDAVVSSGNMDELIQIYGDATHGNFDKTGYLVLKVQEMGYDQAEANVYSTYGTLEDQLYVVGLAPSANGVATGNPSLTTAPTISQGTYVEGGKTFSVKIVDGATANTGTGIMRWLRYNFETGGAFQGEDAFNWHDLVRTNGSKFKTVNGIVYGTAATKGVIVYQNNGTSLHPDFDLFTADDGSTYAPAPSATISLSGLTSGSRVQLYDTANSVELYNNTVGATTLTYSETYSVDRTIRLRVSYVSGTSAKNFIEASIGTITSGSPDISYIVSQTNDTTYNANAIDGPAIYATSGITFTDAATDLVNCNIAGGSVTYPTIYACFVYWNFTSTGIANDFTYIDAPDTANYLFSGMKIKNTSVTALSVTGGYGRDATSGLSSDIIDTAGSTGNIFLAPDHVVPYATGSGVTSQDKIDIASQVLTAAASAPIYAEIIKVAGETVTGSGTELDPWGPV